MRSPKLFYSPSPLVALMGVLLLTTLQPITSAAGDDEEIGDDSPPSPDYHPYNATVSLIVDLSLSSSSIDGVDFKNNLRELLGERSITFAFAAIPASNSSNSTRQQLISSGFLSSSDGDSVNIALDDVTSAAIEFWATNVNSKTVTTDTANLADGTTINTMMIDICPAQETNARITEQVLAAVKDNAYGFYIRSIAAAVTDHSITTTIATNNDVSAPAPDQPFTINTLNDFLTVVNHSYVLKLVNASSQQVYLNLTGLLCRNYASSVRSADTNAEEASGGSLSNDTCCCNCTDQSPQNIDCCTNTTYTSAANGTTESSVAESLAVTQTVILSTSSEENTTLTTTTTTSSLLVKIQSMDYSRKSSSASVAIVFVFLLLAATAACVVYRKKIIGYVASKTAKQQADNQITAIRYGTLMNRDEYDIRGF